MPQKKTVKERRKNREEGREEGSSRKRGEEREARGEFGWGRTELSCNKKKSRFRQCGHRDCGVLHQGREESTHVENRYFREGP